MTQYREEKDFIVRTNKDGSESWIPMDENNSDYQAYLAYVANGDTLPSNSSDFSQPIGGNE
jgi:hypothetical protein